MTNIDAKCGICGDSFITDGGGESLDHHSCNMDVCQDCEDKGLNYFLSSFKEKAEENLDKKLKQLAKLINKYKYLDGDWWKKKSPLYKKLKSIFEMEVGKI